MLRLFAGDDWAQDHHDAGVMDRPGAVLAKARLPEGMARMAGMARLHAMIAGQAGDRAEEEDVQVLAGIAASKPALPTTRQPPGLITPKPVLLDI